MVSQISLREFTLIRRQLEDYSGIVLNEDQGYLVEYRLKELADKLRFRTFGALFSKMATDRDLLSKVVDLMTIKETLWFRDDSLWKTLWEKIIPEIVSRIEAGGMEVRIWSAACSTGQEPYSIIMLIHEYLEKVDKLSLFTRFQVICTDISDDALDFAKAGCYDHFSIQRGLSPERVDRFFSKIGNQYRLTDLIQKNASFFRLNLRDSIDQLGKFDIILCRNVAIYFSNELKRRLFKNIKNMMRGESVLFLGATESLFGISDDYESFSHGNGLYYKVKP